MRPDGRRKGNREELRDGAARDHSGLAGGSTRPLGG
jgi:hypothetical protein